MPGQLLNANNRQSQTSIIKVSISFSSERVIFHSTRHAMYFCKSSIFSKFLEFSYIEFFSDLYCFYSHFAFSSFWKLVFFHFLSKDLIFLDSNFSVFSTDSILSIFLGLLYFHFLSNLIFFSETVFFLLTRIINDKLIDTLFTQSFRVCCFSTFLCKNSFPQVHLNTVYKRKTK